MAKSVTKTIIVKGALDHVYDVWANFENFPRFMPYIKSITRTGDRTSHWVMQGPLGRDVEWNAETTRLEENQRIAWNSKDHSALTTSGQVTFQALPQNETEVTVTLSYSAPAGRVGQAIAEIFSDPEQRLTEDLRHFKRYVENRREPAKQSAS